MAWSNLTFNFEEVLTSSKMNLLDANFDALAAGDAGAPDIQPAAIDSAETFAFAEITLTTDLAVGHGGTGASTAANARSNLGLAIGTDVQAWDVDLDRLAAMGSPSAANQFAVSDGANSWAIETATQARSSLGLGDLATQNTVNNDDWSGTDLSVANGGSGASDAATARSNFGLDTISQAEAEAGTATTTRAFTAQRVAQAIAALTTSAQVDIFTSSGTYTKPGSAQAVIVIAYGGGGGGKGGNIRSSGSGSLSETQGGDGGGGGFKAMDIYDPSDIGATETVTIAAGGSGGAGAVETTSATNYSEAGSDGGDGGVTSFGDLLRAPGGGGGTGFGGGKAGAITSAATDTNGEPDITGDVIWSATGGDGDGAPFTSAQNGHGSAQGGCGGGGGGGAQTTSHAAGGPGGSYDNLEGGGASGGAANGGTGSNSTERDGAGGGGGDITNDANATAGAGGDANGWAAGGGGGGGAGTYSIGGSRTLTAGNGGDGADGLCIVITV